MMFPVNRCLERHVVTERVGGATHPMLNAGGCAKLKPPPAGPCCGAGAGLAGAAGGAAAPAPKVKTPGLLFVEPNPPAPPNWKPPGGHREEGHRRFERLTHAVKCRVVGGVTATHLALRWRRRQTPAACRPAAGRRRGRRWWWPRTPAPQRAWP